MLRIRLILAAVMACGGPLMAGAAPASVTPTAVASTFAMQEGGGAAKDKSAAKEERLKAWKSLDAKQRAELRQRYERMKKLSPEDRARLLERAERLRVEMDKTLAALGPGERAAVEALAPDERRRVLRALIGDRAKVAAARIRSRLTPEERKELDAAKPVERARILGRHRKRQLDALPDRVRKLGDELGLSAKEVRQLHEGSPAERHKHIARMARRRTERYIKEHGLPEGVDAKQWSRLFDGDDETFLRALRRIRIRNPEFGVPRRRFEGRQRQREAMARRLESFGAPSPRERAARPGAQEHALRRRAILKSRDRIEELIVRRLQLPLDLAARLRTQSDDEFVRSYRYTIRVLREGGDLEASIRKRVAGDKPKAKR